MNDYLIPIECLIKNSSFSNSIKISWWKVGGKEITHWVIKDDLLADSRYLAKDGKWEWKPSKFGLREDDFIKRCCYNSVEEALKIYWTWEKTWKKNRRFLSFCPYCNLEFESKKMPTEGFYNRDELCFECASLLKIDQ